MIYRAAASDLNQSRLQKSYLIELQRRDEEKWVPVTPSPLLGITCSFDEQRSKINRTQCVEIMVGKDRISSFINTKFKGLMSISMEHTNASTSPLDQC